MSLVVHTARFSSRDPDRLDTTRMGTWLARKAGKCPGIGEAFAPSWALLKAAKSGALKFGEYELRYLSEMRDSYRVNRAAWDAVLSRDRVVLVCYCRDPDECHRGLLADILAKLGATYAGEIA